MSERLIFEATGTDVPRNHAVTAVTGPIAGQCWRVRELKRTAEGHRVLMSRRTAVGHVHREFHPSVFGLSVVVDVTWSRRALHRAAIMRRKVDDYLLAGVLALLPLAAFEHYHFAEWLFSLLGSGHAGE